MSFIDLFSDRSDLYVTARPHYPESLYEFLASCISISSRARVWDCGAGNGQSSISLVEYFAEVYATDASEQQIANAIQKKCVFYSVQPAEETSFVDDYFDFVTVAQALHWFELDRFWIEVTRVLKSGGIFAAWGYDWFSISPEIDRVIQESILDLIAPYWLPQAHLIWDGYRDVGFPFEPISVPPMTMKVLWNLPELLNYMYTWSATRQCVEQQGTEFFDILSKRLVNVWGQTEERKEILMNFHLIAGRNQLK
jgi:SAM-dependent methyltransferase